MKRFRKDLERTSTLLSKVKNPLHQEFTYSVSEGSTYKEPKKKVNVKKQKRKSKENDNPFGLYLVPSSDFKFKEVSEKRAKRMEKRGWKKVDEW